MAPGPSTSFMLLATFRRCGSGVAGGPLPLGIGEGRRTDHRETFRYVPAPVPAWQAPHNRQRRNPRDESAAARAQGDQQRFPRRWARAGAIDRMARGDRRRQSGDHALSGLARVVDARNENQFAHAATAGRSPYNRSASTQQAWVPTWMRSGRMTRAISGRHVVGAQDQKHSDRFSFISVTKVST